MPSRHYDSSQEETLKYENPGQHRCLNESRIRSLEKRQDQVEERLHDGDISMTKLQNSIDRLADSTDRLQKQWEAAEARQQEGNPWLKLALQTLIQWGLPIIALAVLWAVVQSGQLPGVRLQPVQAENP